eukprot:Skav216029  [mRNA]  locus=scaffold417:135365:135881:+ [translate_table: standard]
MAMALRMPAQREHGRSRFIAQRSAMLQVPVEWVAWPNDTAVAWGSCACGMYLQERCQAVKAWGPASPPWGPMAMAWGCTGGVRRC